jgi:VCBS repeat-containing protein
VKITAPLKAGTYTYKADFALTESPAQVDDNQDLANTNITTNPVVSKVVSATYTVTVPNVAPTIDSFQVSNTDDGTSATEGQTKTYVISASDVNEDTLTYGLVKNSGTANVNINPVTGSPGSFTVQFVTPGSLVLQASANDGTGTANAITTQNKTVTVAPANTAPVANNDSYSVNEGGTLNEPAPGVLGNDTDAENNSLTATLVGTGPSHDSSFTFNSDGSFDYTHDGSETTSDSFTYKAKDGTLDSNTVTVTITIVPVNDVPTCQNVAIETDEDTQGSVAANCSDPDDAALTYEIVDPATDGTASVDVSDLKYDPDENFNGSDSFTYRADDGTAFSAAADVDVTVNPVNDPPPTPGAITSDESLNKDGTFALNWDDSIDVDGDNVTYTLEKRDANDANWSPVASGLTSSSYTFGGSNPAENDEGTWDYRVKAVDSPAGAESAFSTAENLVKVDKSNPNAPTLSFATTGQSLKATVNSVDWYKDSVKIDVSDNDDPALSDTSAGSGVDASSFPASFSVTTNGTSTASQKVKDNATNESTAGTLEVNVDAANPTLGACPTAGPFLVNSGQRSVGPISASDGESGIDSANSELTKSVDTSSTGTKTVTFTAKDNVGHSDTKQCTYNVNTHTFIGFSSPVDNPNYLNSMKAGQAVPLKWQLMDASGNPVTNLQNVTVTTSSRNCTSGVTGTDVVEEYATGSSSLQNLGGGYYQFNWASLKSYAGSCKTLTLNGVGVQQQAYFQFLK